MSKKRSLYESQPEHYTSIEQPPAKKQKQNTITFSKLQSRFHYFQQDDIKQLYNEVYKYYNPTNNSLSHDTMVTNNNSNEYDNNSNEYDNNANNYNHNSNRRFSQQYYTPPSQ
eukprot:60414_1